MASIDTSDLGRLAADFDAGAAAAAGLVRAVIQKGAADIKADAQRASPVDTGNLRSSITYDTRVSADAVVAEIGPTADYGLYVEEGTSTQAPQPYLGPAFDGRITEITAALLKVGNL